MEREDEISKCVNRGVLTHGWLPRLYNMAKSFVVPSCLKANRPRPLTQWKDLLPFCEPTTSTIIGSHVNLTKIVPQEIMQDLPISLPWKVLEKVGIPSVAELLLHGPASMTLPVETRHSSATGVTNPMTAYSPSSGYPVDLQNNFPTPVDRVQQYQLSRTVSVQLTPTEESPNGRVGAGTENLARFRHRSEELPSTSYHGPGHRSDNSTRPTQHRPHMNVPTSAGQNREGDMEILRARNDTIYLEGSFVDGETDIFPTTEIAASTGGPAQATNSTNQTTATELPIGSAHSTTGATTNRPVEEAEAAQTSMPDELPLSIVGRRTLQTEASIQTCTETSRLVLGTENDGVETVVANLQELNATTTTSTATQSEAGTIDTSEQINSNSTQTMVTQTCLQAVDVSVQNQSAITTSRSTECKAEPVNTSTQATSETSTQSVRTQIGHVEMVDIGVQRLLETTRSAEVQHYAENAIAMTQSECAHISIATQSEAGTIDKSEQTNSNSTQTMVTQTCLETVDVSVQNQPTITTSRDTQCRAEPVDASNQAAFETSTQSVNTQVGHVEMVDIGVQGLLETTRSAEVQHNAENAIAMTQSECAHTSTTGNQSDEVLAADAGTQLPTWVNQIAALAPQPATTESGTQCEIQLADTTETVSNQKCEVLSVEASTQLSTWVCHIAAPSPQPPTAESSTQYGSLSTNTTGTASYQERGVLSADASTQMYHIPAPAPQPATTETSTQCESESTDAATQDNRATKTGSTQLENNLEDDCQLAQTVIHMVKRFAARPVTPPDRQNESQELDKMEEEVIWFLSRMRELFAEEPKSAINVSSSQEPSEIIITDARRIEDQQTSKRVQRESEVQMENSSSEITRGLRRTSSDLTINTINCGMSIAIQDEDTPGGMTKVETLASSETIAVHQSSDITDPDEHIIPIELCQKSGQIGLYTKELLSNMSDAEEFFTGITHSLPERKEGTLELLEMYCEANDQQVSPRPVIVSESIVKDMNELRESKSESSLPAYPTKCTGGESSIRETISSLGQGTKARVPTATTYLLDAAIDDINKDSGFIDLRMSRSEPVLIERPIANQDSLTAFFRGSYKSLPIEEKCALSNYDEYEAGIDMLNQGPASGPEEVTSDFKQEASSLQTNTHSIQTTETVKPSGKYRVSGKSRSEVQANQKRSFGENWNITQSLSIVKNEKSCTGFQKLFTQYSKASFQKISRSALAYGRTFDDNLDRIISLGVRISQSDPSLQLSLAHDTDFDKRTDRCTRSVPSMRKKLEGITTLSQSFAMTRSTGEAASWRKPDEPERYAPRSNDSYVNIQARTRSPTYHTTDLKKVVGLEDLSKTLQHQSSKFAPVAPRNNENINTDCLTNRISIGALGIDSGASLTVARHTRIRTATFSPVPLALDEEEDSAGADSELSSVENEDGWAVPDVEVPIVFEDCIKWKLQIDGIAHVVLGKGSFGSVEAAKYKMSDGTIVDVAVKIFNYERSCHTGIIKEAKLLQYLQDTGVFPHFYGYVDIGVGDATNICLVQELFGNGTTLAHLVDGENYLEPKEWMSICIQLVKGLRKIHEKNIFYNDLKENNILVDDSVYGRPIIKFIDVGISTYKQGITYNYTTEQMENMVHVAPEVKNHAPTSVLSDIYGLGQIYLEINEQTSIPGLINVAEACTNPVPEQRVCLDGITACLVAIAQGQQLF